MNILIPKVHSKINSFDGFLYETWTWILIRINLNLSFFAKTHAQNHSLPDQLCFLPLSQNFHHLFSNNLCLTTIPLHFCWSHYLLFTPVSFLQPTSIIFFAFIFLLISHVNVDRAWVFYLTIVKKILKTHVK